MYSRIDQMWLTTNLYHVEMLVITHYTDFEEHQFNAEQHDTRRSTDEAMVEKDTSSNLSLVPQCI
jgi:hypothetical protein